jgi:hypothetical protein
MSAKTEFLFNEFPEFLRLFRLALGEKAWDEKISNKHTAMGILSAIQKTIVEESWVTIPTAVSYLRELKILSEKNLEALNLCGAVVGPDTPLTHRGMAVLLLFLAKNEPGLNVREQSHLKENAQSIQNIPDMKVSSSEFFQLCSVLLAKKSNKHNSTSKHPKKK